MSVNYTRLFADVGVLIRVANDFFSSLFGGSTLTGVITGATQANPVVVTSTAHGLTTGKRIVIQGVGGMTQINGNTYIVKKLTANTFSLVNSTTRADVDGSGYSAYTSGGAWVSSIGAPDLVQENTDIETVYATSGNVADILDYWQQAYPNLRTQMGNVSQTMVGIAQQRLTDRETVLELLSGLPDGSSLPSVLSEIYRDMVAQSKTINKSTVTVGSVTAASGNAGNGQVLLTKVMDGYNPPVLGGTVLIDQKSIDCELAISETMSLTCTADSGSGTLEGEESFQWEGAIANAGPYDYRTEGSGTRVGVGTVNKSQIIANKDLEVWDSNLPVNFDLVSGVAGTSIVQETSASNVYRGTYALKYVGDGSTAAFEVKQEVAQALLQPNRMYLFSCFVKGTAGIATGALLIEFESPGGHYTAGASEKISMNAAALAAATTYGLQYFWWVTPKIIPSDLRLCIRLTGALTNAKNVWVDSIGFGPVQYANGVACGIVAGSNSFAKGDRFTFPLTNDKAGIIQEFFRKGFKFQLPSSATPNISDVNAA